MKIKVVIAIVIFSSCSQKLDPQEYYHYVMNPMNGLIHRISFEEMEYQMMYKPIDWMIYNETASVESNISIASLRKEMKDLEYYHLVINNNRKNEMDNESSDRSFYYAYELEKDIAMVINTDTLPPSLYILEQGIMGSGNLSINLAFPKVRSSDREILISDQFGKSFSFLLEDLDIQNIPALKF
jgi:hypothetical protein